MNIKGMLEEEIESVMESIKDMSPETDEYKKSVDELTKLMDRLNEMQKLELENERLTDEHYIKLAQFRTDKKHRIVDHVLTTVSIVVPAALTIWGTIITLKYDKDGVFPTTTIGRGFINKLLPK